MELFWVRFHFAAQAQSTPYLMLLSVYLFKNFTHVMAVRVLTDIIIYRSCAIPAYLYVARPNVESLEKVLTSCFVSSSPFHGSYSNNPRSVNWVWGDRLNTWDFFGSERVVWYLSIIIADTTTRTDLPFISVLNIAYGCVLRGFPPGRPFRQPPANLSDNCGRSRCHLEHFNYSPYTPHYRSVTNFPSPPHFLQQNSGVSFCDHHVIFRRVAFSSRSAVFGPKLGTRGMVQCRFSWG